MSVWRLFAVVDDIFCLFEGHIQNVAHLKQQYGLNKTANEVIIVIEAYRTLRDRGPYPADQVVRDIQGKFAFVLFDSSSNNAFVASVSSSLIHESVSSRFDVSFGWVEKFSDFVGTGRWRKRALLLGDRCRRPSRSFYWWGSREARLWQNICPLS